MGRQVPNIRFRWVTDVPTPYRNHSFEVMASLFPRHAIDFQVYFMASGVSHRPWRYRPAELKYPSKVFWGIHPTVRGMVLHFNPALLMRLRREKADVVMVGGWGSPSHVLAPVFTAPQTVRILGCESHASSVTRRSAPARWIKQYIVGKYEAFLVPQRRSLNLLVALDPASAAKPVVIFPNIIDSAVYQDRVRVARAHRADLRRELGVSPSEQLWLCPARLSLEKGLVPFISQLNGISGVRLFIAGDGPLRSSIANTVRDQSLPVVLLGQQTISDMVRLYAAADVFVLPSLQDPSPLSAVEACAAGLPVLVSDRIGNLDEVLQPGVNGWVYQPDNREASRDTLLAVAATDRPSLETMGRRSTEVYHERFDSERCVARLADRIVALARQGGFHPTQARTRL